MSEVARGGNRRRMAMPALIAAGLAATLVATAAERRMTARKASGEAELRALRVELQRVEQARTRLERDGDRAVALETGLDATRLRILGAVEALAGSPRITLLGHALQGADAEPPDPDSTDPRVLRLSLELEAPHAVRLTEALDALAEALPGRPVDVAGCRIDRAGPGTSIADDASGEPVESLVASCALDWHWWRT